MSPSPSISVVIPIRNGPALIDACLRSIAGLEASPSPTEVIVVDDASTDATASSAEAWADRLPMRVIRSERQAGPGAARNAGAEAANGEVLAFIDGDCVADPRWLSDLVGVFDDPSVVAVGGGLVSAEKRTWAQRYESVAHPSRRGAAAGDVSPGTSNDFLPGCNILIRRSAFLSVGGFDTTYHLGEDVDMTWRLATTAGRVLYRPDGVVGHNHIDRLGLLLKRRMALGSSEGVLTRRFPLYRRALAFSVPQVFTVAGVVAAIAWSPWAAFGTAALFVDHLQARRVARRRGLGVGDVRIARSLLTAHASVAFRLLTLIDRYFAIPITVAAVVAGAFWSPAFLAVPGLIVVSVGISLIEWLRFRPGLGGVPFVAVRTLDHIAVHAGILIGCVRHRTTLPLRLRLAFAPWTVDLLRFGHSGVQVENDPLFADAGGIPAGSAEAAVDEPSS